MLYMYKQDIKFYKEMQCNREWNSDSLQPKTYYNWVEILDDTIFSLYLYISSSIICFDIAQSTLRLYTVICTYASSLACSIGALTSFHCSQVVLIFLIFLISNLPSPMLNQSLVYVVSWLIQLLMFFLEVSNVYESVYAFSPDNVFHTSFLHPDMHIMSLSSTICTDQGVGKSEAPVLSQSALIPTQT